MKYLSNIASYVNEKIEINELDNKTYISTENMLPNRSGITYAATLPNMNLTSAFKVDDILVSNIRPYFKKIWQATFEGGCSNDVLVIRAKEGISSKFLYYVLSDDKFFDYSMATSKGTKMPRGDKKSIMEYIVPDIDYETQQKIARVLSAIDDKIELNNSINKNLEHQMMLMYYKLSNIKQWEQVPIGEVAEKVAMGPFGSNIKVSTFVSEGVPIISGNHLRGYFLEEPKYNYITEEHAEKLKNSIVYPGDIIFTHAGNIGQVALIPELCKYSRYILSQRQFYLRCNMEKILPEYVNLFFHSKEGQYELLSYANQTGVPSIAQPATNLKKIKLPLPNIQEQYDWLKIVKPLINKYQLNYFENERLTKLRDTLLPKLMTGEIDVDKVEV